MPLPYIEYPTLRQLIERARSLGCREESVPGIVGPRGSAPGRCLVGPNGIPYPLPGIADDQRVYPPLIRSIERTLKIKLGFPGV